MNKKRILELIDIMKKKSDMDHPLSLKEIISQLEERQITVNDRKTLYDDFRYLSESGYEIEYIDGGYYLSDAPFSLSEVKIIIDSINSLKNLDDSFLDRLKNKIYSFVSENEESFLKQLEYHSRHSDRKFINRLEDCLQAIRSDAIIMIKRKDHEAEKIHPVFLYRQNDYYYLYYNYSDSDRIYHMRFDNIEKIRSTDEVNQQTIDRRRVISQIDESSNAFYSDKSTLIRFVICNDSEYLRNRLNDDFVNIVYTKNGFTIKASVNDVLFSRLAGYGTAIRISDQQIAGRYKQYLSDIIQNN